MDPSLAISPYWYSRDACETLARIASYEGEKTYRPTVVVPIVDYVGRVLLVRHNTPEGNWGLVQGHIETTDAHPLAAGLREAYEEAYVTGEKIDAVYPYLGEKGMDFPQRAWQTGYVRGGYYVFIGIALKPGADISIVPPPGQPQVLLERKWCSSLDQAAAILREQPGTGSVSEPIMHKIEQVLIPALENVYQPYAQRLRELRGQYV